MANNQTDIETNETNKLSEALRNFGKGLREVFEDITALEVNTIVVSEINGLKFDAEEAYKSICDIPHPEEYKYLRYLLYQIEDKLKEIEFYQTEAEQKAEQEAEQELKRYKKQLKISENRLKLTCFKNKENQRWTEYENLKLAFYQSIKSETETETETELNKKVEKLKEELLNLFNKEEDELIKDWNELKERHNKLLEKWTKFKDKLKKDEIFKANLESMSNMDARTQNSYRGLRVELEKVCLSIAKGLAIEEKNNHLKELLKKIEEEENMKDREEKNDLLDEIAEPEVFKDFSKNGRFLRQLRKLSELKAVLESSGFPTKDMKTKKMKDIIYAQTIIQIDGDVINRFDHRFLETGEEKRKFLLEVHQNSVSSGEKNWRGLLGFIVDLAQDITASISNLSKKG